MRLRRLLGAASLLIVLFTATAPHSPSDSILLDDTPELNKPQQIHFTSCNRLPAGTTHWHTDCVRDVDPCVACFLQHMRATGAKVPLAIPQLPQHALAVAAPASYAKAIRLRKSSRGPPTLTS